MKKQKQVNIIHQGDVILVRADKLPEGLKPRTDRTLALGESTGHHHTLTGGVVYGERTAQQWIVVEEPGVELQHLPDPGMEHNTVPVPVGVWLVPVQVEDDGEKERRALD
jgi:hypothetical protein